jgi:hypothetical protein
MRKSRFTDSQIMAVLKQAEAGVKVPDLCREHGISSATFYIYGLPPYCKHYVAAGPNCIHLSGIRLSEKVVPKWGIRSRSPQQVDDLKDHYKSQVPSVMVRPFCHF